MMTEQRTLPMDGSGKSRVENRPMWRRLAVYFTTMFPLHLHLPVSAVIFLCFYFATALVRGETPYFGGGLWFGLLTVVLNLLALRVFDELKHAVSDLHWRVAPATVEDTS